MSDDYSAEKTRDDEDLKVKLAHVFVSSNKNVCGDIAEAIESGDIRLAHRLAHSLKGSAGIHGKTRLHKAAAHVADMLKDEGRPESAAFQPIMAVLKAELDAVLEEFAPFAAEEDPPPGSATPISAEDKKKVAAMLDELEALLSGGSLDCLKLTESLRAIPGNGTPLIWRLIHHIEYFEFDMAMETLAQLKEGMKD
jgi:HPt (histidine-containing phosphotransfer) domain-containing protein